MNTVYLNLTHKLFAHTSPYSKLSQLPSNWVNCYQSMAKYNCSRTSGSEIKVRECDWGDSDALTLLQLVLQFMGCVVTHLQEGAGLTPAGTSHVTSSCSKQDLHSAGFLRAHSQHNSSIGRGSQADNFWPFFWPSEMIKMHNFVTWFRCILGHPREPRPILLTLSWKIVTMSFPLHVHWSFDL